jgi:hypothetical protein
MLARALDSDTGVMSYHLPELAKTGLAASVDGYLRRADLSPAWRGAALCSQSALILTTDELAEFAQAYLELVRSWSDTARDRSAGPATRAVRLALFAFPDDITASEPRG